MARSRSGKILIVDNDVLVYIFDQLQSSDKFSFARVVQNIILNYSRVWIPAEVRKEFLLRRNDRRRRKILFRILDRYPAISNCPISVGENEIRLYVGMKDENRGEADALLQGQKAKSQNTQNFEDIVFLSNDEKALNSARKRSITTLPYRYLRAQLRETGLSIP